MKIIYSIYGVILLGLLAGCETHTYEDISEKQEPVEMVSFAKDIQPILQTSCTSCHATGGVAAYYPLTTYDLAKNGINNIIDRIQRPNGDPLKMPQGNSLSSGQINLILQWKEEGLMP